MAREKMQLGLQGVNWAIDRSRDAERTGEELLFFASVAESLWWLTMLDESLWKTASVHRPYPAYRDSHEKGSVILGLRYARNRQVHDAEVTGMQGNPLLNSQAERGWIWRSPEEPDVPEYQPAGEWGMLQEKVYREDLSGNPIIETLEKASTFLESWIAGFYY